MGGGGGLGGGSGEDRGEWVDGVERRGGGGKGWMKRRER